MVVVRPLFFAMSIAVVGDSAEALSFSPLEGTACRSTSFAGTFSVVSGGVEAIDGLTGRDASELKLSGSDASCSFTASTICRGQRAAKLPRPDKIIDEEKG